MDEDDAKLEEEIKAAKLQEAENRRQLLAGLSPSAREFAEKMFADLGLFQ